MVEPKLRNPACAGGIMVGIVAKGKKNSGKARENTKQNRYQIRNSNPSTTLRTSIEIRNKFELPKLTALLSF